MVYVVTNELSWILFMSSELLLPISCYFFNYFNTLLFTNTGLFIPRISHITKKGEKTLAPSF